MVGRETERARIELILDKTPSGPAGIGLEGAPGIGKSTLWREGVDAARERGYRVLCTTPAEPDAQLSFAALGDLLDRAVSEGLADLPIRSVGRCALRCCSRRPQLRRVIPGWCRARSYR